MADKQYRVGMAVLVLASSGEEAERLVRGWLEELESDNAYQGYIGIEAELEQEPEPSE